MNRKLAALLTIIACSINAVQCLAQEHKPAPVTRTDNAVETLHGIRITDHIDGSKTRTVPRRERGSRYRMNTPSRFLELCRFPVRSVNG